MTKFRVPIYGTPQKSATVDTDATEGAIVGKNLRFADGTLVKVSDFGGGSSKPPTYSIESTNDLPEGSRHQYFTAGRAQSAVGGILLDTPTINLEYDPAIPAITAALTGFGALTTDALTEGAVHLYFTKPRVAASLVPGAGIALTVDGSGNTTISADTTTGHLLTDWSGNQLTDWSGRNLVDWYVPTIAVTTVFGRTGDVVAVIDDYASVMDPTTAWAFL